MVIAQVTVETTGTMLLGSEIGAALNALEPLNIDLIGLNCATGPAEMSEHLRYLSKNANCAISVMPNAGLPILGAKGAEYPLGPEELATALETFVNDYGISLIGGCCGTTPAHLQAVVSRLDRHSVKSRTPELDPGASSLYQYVPFRQDKTYLAIGERTNANGSRAFRDALVAEDWATCVEIARDQIRDGAHMLDLSVAMVLGICMKSHLVLQPLPRSPLFLIQQNLPFSKLALRHLVADVLSTPSTTKMAMAQLLASRASCLSFKNMVHLLSPSPLMKRVRRELPNGNCA
jgi:hypothetical protein